MARRAKRYSILDRGTGVWYYKLADWRSYRSTGISIRVNRQGKPTNRHEAEQYAMEEADRVVFERHTGPTLKQFLDPYYGPECPHCARLEADGRPLTAEYRRTQRSRIERYVVTDDVADIKIRELTPGHLEDWKQRLVTRSKELEAENARRRKAGEKIEKRDFGIRTINQTLNALSGAFSEAVHRQEIAYNPALSVSTLRPVEEDSQYGIFTPAELKRMFVTEPESWGYNEAKYHGELDWRPARLYGLLMASIGERPSAILRLDWRHYDGQTLTFPRVKDRRKNRRVVPLIALAIEALDDWREDSVRIGPDDPVFGYDGGGRMGKTWFKKRFTHMMAALGLPAEDEWGGRRVPYSLKYTLETELIDRGANPALVRDLMGHSHQRGAPETVLTPVQARYRRQRAEKLRELLPLIEEVVSDSQ
ncbi:MAG: site-specific integrase [Alkalispirochaeta sp.]